MTEKQLIKELARGAVRLGNADQAVHPLRDCPLPAWAAGGRGGADGGRVPRGLGEPGQAPAGKDEGGHLGAIARNRAFNLLRADRQGLPLEDDVLLPESDGPEKELDRRETARIVRQALSQLDKPQRELFVRHYYYGQTVREAALAMGVNLSAAKTWQRRGGRRRKQF